MSLRLFLVIAVLSATCHPTFAESPARSAGRAVGQFGAGVGEAVGGGVSEGVIAIQPEWITVPPRGKDECLAESGGVVNPTFMRCRNGRQEYVRFDSKGNKKVLSERPIPLQ